MVTSNASTSNGRCSVFVVQMQENGTPWKTFHQTVKRQKGKYEDSNIEKRRPFYTWQLLAYELVIVYALVFIKFLCCCCDFSQKEGVASFSSFCVILLGLYSTNLFCMFVLIKKETHTLWYLLKFLTSSKRSESHLEKKSALFVILSAQTDWQKKNSVVP